MNESFMEELDILEREKLVAHVRQLAPYFARRMGELRTSGLVGDVRTAGLMGAVELVSDPDRKIPFAADLAMPLRVRAAAMKRGVLVRGSGDNVVVCPPLIIQRDQIDVIVDTLAESLGEVAAQL